MKEDTKIATPSSDAAALADQSLTLDEYCQRKSTSDRRVELLGGFFHSETVAGHAKDKQSAFDARFDAFANQPA